MEQKRVLWIAAAVGLFLLVVIGTALSLYSPLKTAEPTLNTLQADSGAWIRPGLETAAYQEPASTSPAINQVQNIVPEQTAQKDSSAVQNMTVYADNTNLYSDGMTTIDLTAIARQTAQAIQEASISAANATSAAVTSNINAIANAAAVSANAAAVSANAAAVSANAAVAAREPAPVKDKPAKAPAAEKTAKAESKPAAKSSPKTAAKTTVKTAPEKKPDQFWVQVAAFTGKTNAEEARSALSKEKISGEIFTFQGDNGVMYYRLRVGPYSTKTEAEYWNTRIKGIEQFAGMNSYVVNSTGASQK